MRNPLEGMGNRIKATATETLMSAADKKLLRDAGITSPEEIAWIGEVKLASSLSRGKRRQYDREDGGLYVAGRAALDAYELIRLHLMMQRDMKNLGPYIFGQDTEHQLERYYEIITKAFADLEGNPPRAGEPNGIRELAKEAKHAEDSHQKAIIITKFINLVHAGGSPWGLEYFGGFPGGSASGGTFADLVNDAGYFLQQLNNLGHQPDMVQDKSPTP